MRPFETNGAFHHATGQDGLRRVAVRGAGVSVLSQTTGFAIHMISTVTLARLLTAADFGVVATVTTFSLLLMNFGLNGFTEAMVQRERIDHALVSNLFWINLGIGLVLTTAFAASGPVLARLYGDPRLAGVVVAMSATIVLTSLSVPHLALMKRRLSFSALSANDVSARAASVAVGIVLGWAGYGYWALVGSAITLPLATCIGAWGYCRWFPGLPRRGVGTRPMVRFALNTYGHFAANYCTRNVDNLLVGWFFGPQALGFYKKAYDLCVLPVAQLSEPLHAVAVPTLSRLTGNSEMHARYVLRALSTLAFVGMGLGAAFALVGNDLVLVLLGPQWAESGRIFTFFAPGIGAMLLYITYSWIHLSIGRPDRLLRWGFIEFTSITILFFLGLRWGPSGIAMAWVAFSWLLLMPALWYAGRPAGLGMSALLGAIWKYILASTAAGFAAYFIAGRVPFSLAVPGAAAVVVHGVAACLSFFALYLVGVILLHGGCSPLYEIAELIREMLPARYSLSLPAIRAAADASASRSAL